MSQFISATRNELKKKKDHLRLARRGHDMLRQKLDELTRLYFDEISKVYAMRQKCQDDLCDILDSFSLARAYQFSPEVLREFMLSSNIFSLDYDETLLSGVPIPSISVDTRHMDDFPYAFASTNILFDDILDDMKKNFLSLVKLSTMEKSCFLLAQKIDSLKVRVNYLKLSLIPKLESEIAYIDMKLEENNTYNTIRLIKAKELNKK